MTTRRDSISQPITARAEQKTLGDASRSRRGLGQSTIMSVMREAPMWPFSPLVLGTLAVVLMSVTVYVGWLVRQRMREGIRNSLETVLAANVAALDLWLEDQREVATRLAEDPMVKRHALVRLTAAAEEGPTGSPAVSQAETDRLRAKGYLGWILTDSSGKIVAGNDPNYIRLYVPLSDKVFESLASGMVVVSRPFSFDRVPENQVGGSEQRSGNSPDAVMCALAPLRGGDGSIAGAVAVMIDPNRQFTEILQVARIGSSGETYAIDRDAVLLSGSRFEDQLKDFGLLEPTMPSSLNVLIRDPGVDLRENALPESAASTWPMTEMADQVTRGARGANVLGYNNYRGVPVVGAWQWLPQYEFGVTTELDVDEAFRPIRILENSFLALLGLVTLAAATLLAFAWLNRPSDRASDRLVDLTRRLGQYDLRKRIGRGGMGTVYLGAHGLLDRTVAIKVLENADATERSLHRFQREVQLTAKLNHPNTIEIYDFGRTDEGTFFYVMEYVDGISLEQLVDYYGRQPAERVVYLLLQICGSIAEAHSAGLIHRDIKPANVLLTSRSGIHDLIKVLDFGLAKQIDQESMQLTRVDSLTGTPLFMSPEAIRDATTAGISSDIYSIGAVGYTLLAGIAPFAGDSSADICAKKLHQEAESPERRINTSLPQDVQDVLMDCLQRNPDDRPESVEALAKRLIACKDCPSWSQQDAALWWDQVFDGPYLDDFEFEVESDDVSKEGTKGDTAVNEKRPVVA